MQNLQNRSYHKELLDGDDIPFADIRQNMKELDHINSWLGGHRITIRGLRKIIETQQSVTICEIGCGGGDNLNALGKFCRQQHIKAKFIGIDIKPACIDYAKKNQAGLDAVWLANDYRSTNLSFNKPDIIFSSLFCHHFSEPELIQMIHWMKNNTRQGFFISDLHRHPLAYFFIKLLTAIFSRSYLVKNDAPLSVQRGFTKKEWQTIFQSAAVKPKEISWQWAFRHLIVFKHD